MTLKQFFDIFKRRLREQSGTAVPVIEVIGDSKRIRVGTCMSHTNTLTFDEKKTNHWPRICDRQPGNVFRYGPIHYMVTEREVKYNAGLEVWCVCLETGGVATFKIDSHQDFLLPNEMFTMTLRSA